MALYQKTLENTVVAVEAASSPGTGWTAAASLQAVLNAARSAKLPLFLKAGTYVTGALDVTTATGGGNPLELVAEPGTVTIRLSGSAPHLLNVVGVNSVFVRGIAFDGDNKVLTGSGVQGLIRFQGASANDFLVENCAVSNSTKAGIVVAENARGSILDNRVFHCQTGIYCVDGQVTVERNNLTDLFDNGVCVWTSSQGGNGSIVRNNTINWVANQTGGTGEYGNGVLVFRAGNVKVVENNIFNVKYSAIRLNAASNCHVLANHCWNAREVAIFVEAPGAGLNLIGGVVSGNTVTTAGHGISVANAGLYGDGLAARCVVSNNVISDITVNTISDPGYVPSETSGMGISAEMDTDVTANVIQNTAGPGISLGINDATRNVMATGNLIMDSPMGIGYSANSAARSILISSNLIRGYRNITAVTDPNYRMSGAIVSCTFTGTSYDRDTAGGAANTDYGNATQTSVGSLTVGMNRANT